MTAWHLQFHPHWVFARTQKRQAAAGCKQSNLQVHCRTLIGLTGRAGQSSVPLPTAAANVCFGCRGDSLGIGRQPVPTNLTSTGAPSSSVSQALLDEACFLCLSDFLAAEPAASCGSGLRWAIFDQEDSWLANLAAGAETSCSSSERTPCILLLEVKVAACLGFRCLIWGVLSSPAGICSADLMVMQLSLRKKQRVSKVSANLLLQTWLNALQGILVAPYSLQ